MILSKDTARTIVGIIGNIIALVLFLSPLPTIMKIWKKKSVEQYSATPYLATFLSCGIWVLYGIPNVHPNSFLVMTVNGVGVAIEIVYLFVFLFCSDKKKRFTIALIVVAEVVFMGVLAILVLVFAHSWKLRSTIVGSISVGCCILMYASPLAIMKLVITTKSAEYMPFSISLCLFANGLSWTIYALIRMDPFILAPNGLGAVFGLVQLILYAKYYKSNKTVEEKQVDMKVDFSLKGLSSQANKPSCEA